MNIPYAFRKCSKCGEWKVANNFNYGKDKKAKWELKYKCKKCEKEYRENNKNKIAKK